MKFFTIVLLSFFFASCDHEIFVHKKDVIYNQKGYILFYYETEEAIFFPFKDTVDSKFLGQSHLNGYRITYEQKINYLKKIAITQMVRINVLLDGKSIPVNEPIKLIPVTVQYYWGEEYWPFKKIKEKQKINIKYNYNNKEIDLFYRPYEDMYIISISPTRESDKK